MNKVGRNDKCWCGSDLKYKKCHLESDQRTGTTRIVEPVDFTREDIARELKRHFGKKYCLHPLASKKTCSGEIIKAHTVQKSGGLSSIARDGHVYCVQKDFNQYANNNGKLAVKYEGISRASTFTGFCSGHDKTFFSHLEDEHFQPTDEQVFLLTFRAVARELYCKRAAYELRRFHDKLAKQTHVAEFEAHIKIFNDGIKKGLNDIESIKYKLDKVYKFGEFNRIKYYIIEFDEIPSVACSGAIFVEDDFTGRALQVLDKDLINPVLIAFSLLRIESSGFAILSWLDNNDICDEFIKSLNALPRKTLSNALTRFAFEYFENLFISPDWWEQLEEKTKMALMARLSYSINIFNERNVYCLMDDGISYADWQFKRVTSNVINSDTCP